MKNYKKWVETKSKLELPPPPPLSLSPSGGCSMSPFFSHVPMGWMSDESTSLQKSLLLSLPSRRRRSRTPVRPITVAMQTEVELRGSWASSFIPTLKSLEGGAFAYSDKIRHNSKVRRKIMFSLFHSLLQGLGGFSHWLQHSRVPLTNWKDIPDENSLMELELTRFLWDNPPSWKHLKDS